MTYIGQTFKLQKCKHKWNNEKVVTVVEVQVDGFLVRDREGKDYQVGARNLARLTTLRLD